MRRQKHTIGVILVIGLAVAASGCGVFSEAVFQTAGAAGRTAFDLFLTDLVNSVAAGQPVDPEDADDDQTADEDPAGG